MGTNTGTKRVGITQATCLELHLQIKGLLCLQKINLVKVWWQKEKTRTVLVVGLIVTDNEERRK